MADILYADESLAVKVNTLTPSVKKSLLESMEQLYLQESYDMLDVLGESREEMQQGREEFEHFMLQGSIREKRIDRKIRKKDQKAMERYLRRKEKQLKTEILPEIQYVSGQAEKERNLVMKFVKKKEKEAKKERRQREREDRMTSASSGPRGEGREELFQAKSAVQSQLEESRARQAERIAAERNLRADKSAKERQKAEQLLEAGRANDRMVTRSKEKQQDTMNRMLEERRGTTLAPETTILEAGPN